MTWQDIYLICFVGGLAWTLLTLVMGGLHLHLPHMHVHGPGLHSHAGGAHAGSHGGSTHGSSGRAHLGMSWISSLLNPSAFSLFLAWFGGAGYLLTRGAVLEFWLVLVISVVAGTAGALSIAWVMRLVSKHEKPMDPADYEIVGVLGTVTSVVRPGGVGEMVFVREGSRRPLAVKSERSLGIERGTEVVVTRFENGIAYVKTWTELAGDHRFSEMKSDSGEANLQGP